MNPIENEKIISGTNLLYIHIGNKIPDYLYINIYQTLLISCRTPISEKLTIYILLNDNLIEECKSKLDFDTSRLAQINPIIFDFIPISQLENSLSKAYLSIISKFSDNYSREEFWINTTLRFFYICQCIKLRNITNVFHIENDVLLYESLDNITKEYNLTACTKLCMVQDAENRAVPSIIFIPSGQEMNKLLLFINDSLNKSDVFINDMNLLGTYKDKYSFSVTPTEGQKYVYDGAAIGQYLGGGNSPNIKPGYINETCTFKVNTVKLITSLNNTSLTSNTLNTIEEYFTSTSPNNYQKIVNLHIHCKNLYRFVSCPRILFEDIISGDRIVSKCDFIFSTPKIQEYHRNLSNFIDVNKILVNWSQSQLGLTKDLDILNKFKFSSPAPIKLFIYSHILEEFMTKILYNLPVSEGRSYILYLHNSDEIFTEKYTNLVLPSFIKKIYVQNLNYNLEQKIVPDDVNKLCLLPIGIANSMFPHGNLEELYSAISNTFYRAKTKNVYVQVNPDTYAYRKFFMEAIGMKYIQLPYREYLEELSKHRFCLCIRGNGVDTHRFWECLYLGVVPIILNNNSTNCSNFVHYLRSMTEFPQFYEIKHDDIKSIADEINLLNSNNYIDIIKNKNYNILSLNNYKD